MALKTKQSWLMLFLLTLISLSPCLFSNALKISYDNRALTFNGERKLIISGSIHYPRSTPEMWPDLILKAKEGGLNAIDTYVFWNVHEPIRRQYDFSGNHDLVKFIRTIQQAGLYAILRIGPYVCAEWNFGGFPVWLHNTPNMTFRTNNEPFKDEMKIFTTLIVDMMKKNNLLAGQGGPIILTQIENEYKDAMSAYGDEGKKYLQWCSDFAQTLDVGVPWIMCKQPNAPKAMIDTCNGFYCDQNRPSRKDVPKMWTENWTGWFNEWFRPKPHRPAEDIAFAVARFYQLGGTLQNYYMYHGGTNFGRTSGGPYITTSYDYDAPLDEYGNLNQPKWGHLKQLHNLLMSMEKTLTYGISSTHDYGNMLTATVFDDNGTRVCFFANANAKEDLKMEFGGKSYTIPAWSVSILPDCVNEVYNTARVNTQTSVMVYAEPTVKPTDAEQPLPDLKWRWREEHFNHIKNKEEMKDVTYANQLLDQKAVSNDTSDYVWYMTSVNIDDKEPFYGDEVILRAQTLGPLLHAFVNGKHVGTHWGKNGTYSFVFEAYCNIKRGKNDISFLSVSVGLQNYGPKFDLNANGLLGPVKLVSPNSEELDLSNNQWVYKVGLDGYEKELYEENISKNKVWHSDDLPMNRMFVWYRTPFTTPPGIEPVVLDLEGLGKGTAWVNGHNIGRYWPSMMNDEHGCNTCDYRGTYGASRCRSNCGKPTQRWYHVPRYFLHDDKENALVLFEELGGHPYNVKVEIVTIGTICANAYEGNTLELSCQGRTITQIKFASFGDPKGTCGAFQEGTCHSPNTLSIIQQACVGKESCLIDVSDKTFASTTCKSSKRLAIEAVC